MRYYEEEAHDEEVKMNEEYCDFCWDKRKKKDKELFFLDKANNMRLCLFCPNCGRAYNGGV